MNSPVTKEVNTLVSHQARRNIMDRVALPVIMQAIIEVWDEVSDEVWDEARRQVWMEVRDG